MAQAGWYPDPNSDRYMRYWDGRSWTARLKYPRAKAEFEDRGELPAVPPKAAEDSEIPGDTSESLSAESTDEDWSAVTISLIFGIILSFIGGVIRSSYLSDPVPNSGKFLAALIFGGIGLILTSIGIVAIAVHMGTRELTSEVQQLRRDLRR